MGIYLHLAISKSVTQEEWEKVYPETLHLVKNFHLAEERKVKIHDIDLMCLVPTEERTHTYGWFEEKKKVGWSTVGDYHTLTYAEDFFLPRNLTEHTEWGADAGDAMMTALPGYLGEVWNDPRFHHTYHLWGSKTQGEPYHRYLLAIACLIAARLGEKAFVYGDISYDLCKEAVSLANQYVEKPVVMPDQCDRDRFMQRVKKLPISNSEKDTVFEALYAGEDAEDCRMELYMTSFEDKSKKYEIDRPSLLKYYEQGDRIDPQIAYALGKSRQFLDSIVKEEECSDLMKKDAKYRCEWLIRHNHYLLLRDKDWEKIFTEIEQHAESFGRYYSIFRVKMKSEALLQMGIALLLNDALYEYSGKLAVEESK